MPRDPSLGDPEQVLEYLEVFLEHFPEDIILYRLDQPDDLMSLRFVFSGHKVSPASGVAYSGLMGLTLRDTFPSIPAESLTAYTEVLRTGESQLLPDLRFGTEDLPERVYRATAHKVADNLIGVVVEDVSNLERADSERKAVMAELRLKARELARSNQELEDFAYVASHDLKAPLRDIANLASWISEDAAEALPEQSRGHLERLRERIIRMSTMLDDLLAYSRAGRLHETSHSAVDVDIGQVLDDVRELAAAPDTYTIDVAENPPRVETPRMPLMQVFSNLIGNAIKHRSADDGRVAVSWRDDDRFIEFSVSDNGPGIPVRFHERIFRLFTTLRPRDDVEGSGMGLAIVKKLVEGHGGRITLESRAGEGSTFRFTWPKRWSPDQRNAPAEVKS
ncbi:MAG: ATP-binding protein [Myxococcota bacterium]